MFAGIIIFTWFILLFSLRWKGDILFWACLSVRKVLSYHQRVSVGGVIWEWLYALSYAHAGFAYFKILSWYFNLLNCFIADQTYFSLLVMRYWLALF